MQLKSGLRAELLKLSIVPKLAAGLLVAIALSCSFAGDADAKKIIRAGTADPLSIPHSKAMLLFKDLVERRSNGELEVQIFPALQLGEIAEQVHAVQDGNQEMMQTTAAWFSRFFPAIDVVELPYLVTDWESAQRMYRSPAIKKLADAAEAATGIKILGWYYIGFRHTLNKKHPISTVANFDKLKLRLQDSPVHMATFRALGSNPIVVPWGETPKALESGLVDGLENSLANFISVKFYENAKYLSMTGHFFNTSAVLINAKFYKSLTDQERAIIDEAAMAGEQMSLILARDAENDAKIGLRDRKVIVNDLAPDEVRKMKAKVQPIYDQFGPKFEPYLTQLREAADKK